MKKHELIEKVLLGSAKSGHYGHKGIPGHRGGSTAGGAAVAGPTDVEWAKGVRAAKDMGGQVPQKAVKQADKILQKEGLAPTTRKAPKTFAKVKEFYETTRPIPGDIWEGKGIVVEIGTISRSGVGGTRIGIHTRTSKGGRSSDIYTDKDWTDPSEPDWSP